MFFRRKKGNLIKVRVKVAGFVNGKLENAEFELEVPEGTTIKKLFALADKSGKAPGRALGKILSMPRPPTVLLNGAGLDLPEQLERIIAEGDEIAIMTPLAGG